jgi:hypothetical protein
MRSLNQTLPWYSCISITRFLVSNYAFLGANLLVGIAGENLAQSIPESVGERSEQFALGLQQFAPNRQLVCESKVELCN